jgi:hypothetical protein
MDKSGVVVPEEIAKESPVSLINTPSNFLKVVSNFSNIPWIHEYSKGSYPSNEEFVEDMKAGRIVIGRGIATTLDLKHQEFQYSKAKGGKCKYSLFLHHFSTFHFNILKWQFQLEITLLMDGI